MVAFLQLFLNRFCALSILTYVADHIDGSLMYTAASHVHVDKALITVLNRDLSSLKDVFSSKVQQRSLDLRLLLTFVIVHS
jgi:hypothetical protein